jgi:hypothetical protein
MDIPHGSDGSLPREGAWLGKAGLAAAGLMIGVTLGMVISPWTVPPPQETALRIPAPGQATAAPFASVDRTQAAPMLVVAPPAAQPAEIQGMEVCWGGIEQARC